MQKFTNNLRFHQKKFYFYNANEIKIRLLFVHASL